MVISLDEFNQALHILKNHGLEEITAAIQSTESHLRLSQSNLSKEVENLRQFVIFYKKNESQTDYKKQSIRSNEIDTWIPVLKKHQKANVYTDVKVKSVEQIMSAKKQIEHLDLSLSEMKIKLTEQGRKTKILSNEVKTLSTQLSILKAAADLFGFFTANGYDPEGIAEFEFDKYYELYQKGVDVNG